MPYSTARRWVAREDFQKLLAERRKEVFGEVRTFLHGLVGAALLRLKALVASENESVALQAIKATLDHWQIAVETGDFYDEFQAFKQEFEAANAQNQY